jgi:RNA polymerase sigma-70 factor (sigma-E family)
LRNFVDDFDAEFDNLWSRAYGVAYVVLGNRAESEDVAQETLARALVRWKKVSAYAEPWVVRVAGNLAIDRVRRTQRARGLPAPADLPALDAQRVDLQRALLALSPKQREVVVLRYLVDLPEAEVAETLGCSVGTVKTHASRGLAALRKSLEVAP